MVKQKTFEWSLERGDLLPLLMMLPTLLVILFVMVFPLVYGLLLSFFTIGFGGSLSPDSFVGLDNYLQFFTDPVAMKATLNTVLFSFGAIAGDFVLGTLVSLGLLKLRRSASVLIRPIVTMPRWWEEAASLQQRTPSGYGRLRKTLPMHRQLQTM